LSQAANLVDLKRQTDSALLWMEQATDVRNSRRTGAPRAAAFENGEVRSIREIIRKMEAAERRSLGLSIEQYGASEEKESRILAGVTMGQGAALLLLFLTIRGESNSRSEMGFNSCRTMCDCSRCSKP
jgi:hypothetical protein